MARAAKLSWRGFWAYERLVWRRVFHGWKDAIGRDATVVAVTMAVAAIGGGDSSLGAAWSGATGAVVAILVIAFLRAASQSARIYFEQVALIAEARKVISFRHRLLRHRREFARVRDLPLNAAVISEALRRKQRTFMRFVKRAMEKGQLDAIITINPDVDSIFAFRDLCEELDALHPGEIQKQSDVGAIDLTQDPPLTVDDVGAAQLIDMSIQAVVLLASDHIVMPDAASASKGRK